ncbi:MAG: serine/threonine-protein phosphatase [Lachnospiraceae bacterium]|nr:serine/threonine-protein phosphatase [Lachnospiraceae bacterium]
MLSGVYWNIGMEMDANQDSVILERVMTKRGELIIAGVCDGIGGLERGEIASGYVTERLLSFFYEEILPRHKKKGFKRKIRKALLRCLYATQRDLEQFGKQEKCRLGTTISMVIVWNNRYLWCHMGDSRIYRISWNICRQLTRDDRYDGKLTGALGSMPWTKPVIQTGHLFPGQGILLCSDGFWEKLDKKKISDGLMYTAIHRNEQIDRHLKALGEYAMRQGEKDNMSAIYLLRKKERQREGVYGAL